MAGFVLGHFVNGVVDGVIAQLLGLGGNGQFAFAGAGFGLVALLEVGLGVPHHLADELGELGGVLGLFESVALEGLGNFRIAFALGLAAHRKVHAHFGAFGLEVMLQAGPYLRVAALGYAQYMLTGPLGLVAFFLDF